MKTEAQRFYRAHRYADEPTSVPSEEGYLFSVFSVAFTSVAAAILAAVEGGILPPGPEVRIGSGFPNHTPIPPGRMPGSTAGKMPAATLNRYWTSLSARTGVEARSTRTRLSALRS